ncbi:hypothetical protein, partial [Ralstonia solanacearum]|uniref:hypothetical protein n=1 Tax=Ralstonia solanacearum TaxID=305 RepID=UPI0018AFEC18
PSPLIDKERRATVSAESAMAPFFAAIATAFLFFIFEIKEKERGEKTEKVRATVSKGCLFLSHGIAGLPPLISWHFLGSRFVVP